jgi:L-gulono-1,4-lactone dehydrogenase
MEHPPLKWKPNKLHCEMTLKPTTITRYSSLEAIKAAIAARPKAAVYVITRTRATTPEGTQERNWTILAYQNTSIHKVHFQKIRIEGLPLGGSPTSPCTYIAGTDDRLGEIAYVEDGYFLRDARKGVLDQDPRGLWVESFVPAELENHGSSVRWLPKLYLVPSMEDLVPVMRWVHGNLSKGTKIKAGGSRHSWSQVAVTNGVYIAPEQLKGLSLAGQTFDPDVYKKDLPGRGVLLRGGSGNTVREVNRFAWLNGLAFPGLGGYDGQTLGGVFPTGTHGSVFTRSHLAETVVSMDLVIHDGSLVRIEPAGGITDPAAFAEHFTDKPATRLVQEDETFNAALISMGTMGVVRSYVLELTAKFHMNEVRTASNISELKEKLKGAKISAVSGVEGTPSTVAKQTPTISSGADGGFKGHPLPAYHLEFLFNPHGNKVVVTSRHPVAVEESEDSELEFQPPGRDLIRTLKRGASWSRPALPTWAQERFNHLVVWALDTAIRLLPGTVPALIDSAMDTLVDAAYADRSFNVFNSGFGTNQIPALACTVFVPVDGDRHLDALDAVLAAAAANAGRGRHETAPVSMRFVGASRALLGVPVASCAFEFIFTASTRYAQEVVDGYDAALRKALGDENVRVHWGQMMGRESEGKVQAMYPLYERWRRVRNELDPDGRFLSGWQERVLPAAGAVADGV